MEDVEKYLDGLLNQAKTEYNILRGFHVMTMAVYLIYVKTKRPELLEETLHKVLIEIEKNEYLK